MCPQIEWNEGEFIDERIGEAVFREVDRLEISTATVATLDTDVGKTFGAINRKLGAILFLASRADGAAVFPFSEAKTTEQIAASVALLAQNACGRFAMAKRALGQRVTLLLRHRAGTDEFRAGLKEGQRKKFLRCEEFGGRGPAMGEKVGPRFGRGVF